ncbi:aminoacyl-tRNA deacylase [Motiliproteus sp. SC1-56]|uniref:aminoacyl-tRNA deacylase n=1 Tax=Motiliproteus sp. SC1-56 TaxID=2799565 RepID=UPI001A8F3A46|nr:YbaK/EbsC family protein [Motiliproteus sp. SC1-56]
MTMSMTLSEYLADHHADYNLLKHKHTTNAFDTAYTAHIPMEHLAKAVVLEDTDGHHLMAVVPSMRRLKLRRINRKLGRNFRLVSEVELKALFQDCDLGAIPAMGQAYEMDTICDEDLLNQPYVYIEAGDHEELIKLERAEFQRLMSGQLHDYISLDSPTHSPYQDADLRHY